MRSNKTFVPSRTSLLQGALVSCAQRVMPQSRGPWDKLQLVLGGIRKGSGQAESLSYPTAQAIAPETEALPERAPFP
jgi:hypothetical protein